MSNRLLCPISLASKMWYWSPVIGKVECIKLEDIKIGLLWCLDFPPVNYYSISKQEGSTLNCTYPNQMNSNCTRVWLRFCLVLKVKSFGQLSSVTSFWLIWLHLFIGTLDKNKFLHLEKHLNQEWAFFQLEGVGNQNCK